MRDGVCVVVWYKSEGLWGSLGGLDVGSGKIWAEGHTEDLNPCILLSTLGDDGSSGDPWMLWYDYIVELWVWWNKIIWGMR